MSLHRAFLRVHKVGNSLVFIKTFFSKYTNRWRPCCTTCVLVSTVPLTRYGTLCSLVLRAFRSKNKSVLFFTRTWHPGRDEASQGVKSLTSCFTATKMMALMIQYQHGTSVAAIVTQHEEGEGARCPKLISRHRLHRQFRMLHGSSLLFQHLPNDTRRPAWWI